eukprot:symbB.v1.2.010391.t1/scaffold638.1/size177989/10
MADGDRDVQGPENGDDGSYQGPGSKKLDQLSRQGSLSVFRDIDMDDLLKDAHEQQLLSEPKYTSHNLDVPVVIVTSEISPWSKSGGLALVTASLALELAGRGHRTMAISPMYDNFANCSYLSSKTIWLFGWEHEVKYFHMWQALEPEGTKGVDYIFVDHPCYHRPGGLYYNAQEGVEYADNLFRFALFTLAALEAPCCCAPGGAPYGERVMFIANDWQSALLPVYLTHRMRPMHRPLVKLRFAYAGISDHDWLEEGWNKTAWAPWHVSAAVHCWGLYRKYGAKGGSFARFSAEATGAGSVCQLWSVHTLAASPPDYIHLGNERPEYDAGISSDAHCGCGPAVVAFGFATCKDSWHMGNDCDGRR